MAASNSPRGRRWEERRSGRWEEEVNRWHLRKREGEKRPHVMRLPPISHERRPHRCVWIAGWVQSGTGAADEVGRRGGVTSVQTGIAAAGHSVKRRLSARRRGVRQRMTATWRRRRQKAVLSGAIFVYGRVPGRRRRHVTAAARRRRTQRRHSIRVARCVTHFRLVDAVPVHVEK